MHALVYAVLCPLSGPVLALIILLLLCGSSWKIADEIKDTLAEIQAQASILKYEWGTQQHGKMVKAVILERNKTVLWCCSAWLLFYALFAYKRGHVMALIFLLLLSGSAWKVTDESRKVLAKIRERAPIFHQTS